MKINCSGGKGIMELDTCLECALTGGNICGYDYALIRAMMSDEEKSKRKEEVHVTDLTGCLRKAWYDKCDPTPEYIHETLARWLGVAIHAAAEGSNDILDCELPLKWAGIVGKSDVVYKDGRIVDYKTTRWISPVKLPYGSHALQVNIYAWMLRKMGREVKKLQIQYIDASGPTKCRACKVPVRMFGGEIKCPSCMQFVPNAHLGAVLVDIPIMSDEDVEDQILDKKEELDAAITMKMAPAKEPGYLCSYCPHSGKCNPEVVEGD